MSHNEERTCLVCGKRVPSMQGVLIGRLQGVIHPECEGVLNEYRSKHRLPAIVKARLRERWNKKSA